MKLVEVQVLRQNTGNWKFDIEGPKCLINVEQIKTVRPEYGTTDVFSILMVGDTHQDLIRIDTASYEKLKGYHE